MSTKRMLMCIAFVGLLAAIIAEFFSIIEVKSFVTLLFVSVAAVGAICSMISDNNSERVCQKAKKLDDAVSTHKIKYHGTSKGNPIAVLNPHKGNGICKPDTVSHHFNRRV